MVVILTAGLTVKTKLAVAELDAESVTFAVKLAVPAIGVAPDSTPALERLRPTEARLEAPEVTVQL